MTDRQVSDIGCATVLCVAIICFTLIIIFGFDH